jgi:NAD(P)-dependent dehydrogenase (short-subunit alcohol dehydrogenase family)
MNRVALITGAARRIGATLARALAADGYAIGVHYHSSAAPAQELVAELVAAGGHAASLKADLSDRASVRNLVASCEQALGTVTVLVNNAASFRYDTADSFTGEDLDFHLRPDLEAPLILAQEFARALGPASGMIVNMLDHKVIALNPDFFSYTIAKVGLAGATRILAQWFAGRIRVNGVAPGITLVSGKQTEAGFRHAWTAPPLGRSATPEEIAEAVRFILTTPSLNGQILVLDGGESLLARPRDVAFDVERGKEGFLF